MILLSDNMQTSIESEQNLKQTCSIDDDCSFSTVLDTTTKKKQQKIDFTTIIQEKYLPKEADVIIGNGGSVRKHTGNVHFKNIIDSKLKDYSSFSLRRDKTNMIRSIVNQIHKNSGIFVRKHPTTGTWFEVDDVIAREKISQAFRNSIYRKCNRLHASPFCSSFSSSSAIRKGNSSIEKKRRSNEVSNDIITNTNNKEEKLSSLSFDICSKSMIKNTLSSSSPTAIRLPSNDIRRKEINYSRNNNHRLEIIHHPSLKVTHEKNGLSLFCAFDNLISSLPSPSIGYDDPFEPIPIF